MKEELLEKQLEQLLLGRETEIVEFKEAKNNFDSTKLGKYFSALANEANLQSKESAWLVFGVSDKNQIVGTTFRENPKDLDSLKKEIAQKTTHHLSFLEIYSLSTPQGRVVLFQIPAAPKGLPIAWEGHYYGRNGEELSPLNIDEIERIRRQVAIEDWSRGIVAEASIEDLDEISLAKARQNYKERNPQLAQDLENGTRLPF